jgi:hypothetical protein
LAADAINAFLPLWVADRCLTAAAIGQILAAALLRVIAGPGWGNVVSAAWCSWRWRSSAALLVVPPARTTSAQALPDASRSFHTGV